jgi:hypothetical protein
MTSLAALVRSFAVLLRPDPANEATELLARQTQRSGIQPAADSTLVTRHA